MALFHTISPCEAVSQFETSSNQGRYVWSPTSPTGGYGTFISHLRPKERGKNVESPSSSYHALRRGARLSHPAAKDITEVSQLLNIYREGGGDFITHNQRVYQPPKQCNYTPTRAVKTQKKSQQRVAPPFIHETSKLKCNSSQSTAEIFHDKDRTEESDEVNTTSRLTYAPADLQHYLHRHKELSSGKTHSQLQDNVRESLSAAPASDTEPTPISLYQDSMGNHNQLKQSHPH